MSRIIISFNMGRPFCLKSLKYIWLCNGTLDGDTLQLQNGGRTIDVAHIIQALGLLVKRVQSATIFSYMPEVLSPYGLHKRLSVCIRYLPIDAVDSGVCEDI